MLEEGSVIELTLPGQEAPTQATVLSCSATMKSVRLQELGSEEVHRISLQKLPYTVVRLPGEQPAGGQPDAQQQAGEEEEPGSGSGSEGDEEQPGSGSDEDAHQEDSGSDAAGSEGEEEEGSQEDDEEGSQGDDSGDEEEEDAALDAFSASTASAVEAFAAAVTADPAAFLQPTPELASLAKAAAKALYDYQAALDGGGAAGGSSGAPAGVLPELYVEGFDAEQIWLQLELAAGPALKRARKLLKKAGQEPELLTAETEEAIDELLEGGEPSGSEEEQGFSDEEDEEEDDGSGLDESDEDFAGAADLADIDYDALLAAGAAHRLKKGKTAGGAGSDSEDEGAAAEAQPAKALAGSKRKRAADAARAAVEDDYFKLDEMEAFLEQAEREEAGIDDEGDADQERDAGGSDAEEAELEALLDEAVDKDKKRGKQAKKKGKKPVFGAEEAEDEDAELVGASAMYEDFFGPRRGGWQGPATVAAGGRRQLDDMPEEGAGFADAEEQDEDEEENEDEEQDDYADDLLSDDMLSDEEGLEGQRGQGNGAAAGKFDSEEDDEEGGFEDDGDDFEERGGMGVARRAMLAESDEEGSDEDEEELAPSAHERRQERIRDKIRRLEEQAMGEKEWFMRGEVDAAKRPKNSALEVDLDFESTVKPPPQPTEEMTQTLDEMIKRRIAEARFDDVVRIVAPPPETKRTTLELDDSKPQQGLGELYEQEYMQTVAGVADDKDEELRQAARAQFSALCAQLDALSHLHFTPRPVLEEVTVKVDVPAIMMEEAAPQFVSGASMRAPEEVFATGAAGAPKAEEELTREERKRRRAQKKRAGKKRRSAKDEERAAKAAAQGGTAPVAGRKSAAADEAARQLAKASKKRGGVEKPSRKGEYSKSASVFTKIQQHMDGTSAAAAAAQAASAAPRAAHLKL